MPPTLKVDEFTFMTIEISMVPPFPRITDISHNKGSTACFTQTQPTSNYSKLRTPLQVIAYITGVSDEDTFKLLESVSSVSLRQSPVCLSSVFVQSS